MSRAPKTVRGRPPLLLAGAVLAIALGASACVAGLGRGAARAAPEQVACRPRWAAPDDPGAAPAAAARAEVAADLPEGARALLPDRAARLSTGCALSLPVSLASGRCYLFAAQIVSSADRPAAAISWPDSEADAAAVHRLDHAMAETFGRGADPVCYRDDLEGVVEVRVEGEADLVWVQGWEMSPGAARAWSGARRRRLAEAAASPRAAPGPEGEREEAPGGAAPAAGGGAGEPDEEPVAEPGAAPEAAAAPAPELDEEGSPSEPAAEPEPAAEEPVVPPPPAPEELPAGPLATETADLCRNGLDDDGDGRADCADPDCEASCALRRLDRVPWGRLLDLRLGAAARVSHLPGADGLEPIQAAEPLDPRYDRLAARWGMGLAAAAVYRPSRYLGLGLELGLGWLSLSSYPPAPNPRGSQNRVTALAVSAGLGVQVSVPVSVLELGASVGLGWLALVTSGEERLLSGEETDWVENPAADRTSHHGYASGLLWIDAWVADGFAVGLYGGVLAPLDQTPGLPANDYHAGLRTTLRLELR